MKNFYVSYLNKIAPKSRLKNVVILVVEKRVPNVPTRNLKKVVYLKNRF